MQAQLEDIVPKLYTKYGDRGETGLLYGGRVPKTDLRVEAYGTVDEAVAALGLARALATTPRVKEITLEVQRALFTVAAELATSSLTLRDVQDALPAHDAGDDG